MWVLLCICVCEHVCTHVLTACEYALAPSSWIWRLGLAFGTLVCEYRHAHLCSGLCVMVWVDVLCILPLVMRIILNWARDGTNMWVEVWPWMLGPAR